MTRSELLKELDRIIDVGIVNAKHDSDVLKYIRKLLISPVYVVTSGCYSDYTIQGVTFDEKLAEKFKNYTYEPNEIEVYLPLELKTDDVHHSEQDDSFEVDWEPETNKIHKLEYMRFWSETMYMERSRFRFWLPCSQRILKDVLANGKESELIKKIAQDKYAAWKYENKIIHVGGMAGTQKAFDDLFGKDEENGRSKADP